ncbi:MAG TPA: thiamine phosphate synthase [Armatimonadetes bacterium]|nr:thiamine phosphate synthase [Armatimonadota bacterium]
MAGELRARIRGLYVLTEVTLTPRTHEEIAAAALAGGAQVLQLRDKTRSDAELLPVARILQARCRAAGVVFIVNDRVELARAVDADGVHLGEEDWSVEEARAVLGPEKLIGRTVRSLAQARQAYHQGADYLGLGPIFATETKAGLPLPLGVEVITEVKARVPLPVVAIGGITRDNIALVAAAGADAAAVVSAVVRAEDMPAAVAELAQRFAAARRGRRNPPASGEFLDQKPCFWIPIA